MSRRTPEQVVEMEICLEGARRWGSVIFDRLAKWFFNLPWKDDHTCDTARPEFFKSATEARKYFAASEAVWQRAARHPDFPDVTPLNSYRRKDIEDFMNRHQGAVFTGARDGGCDE